MSRTPTLASYATPWGIPQQTTEVATGIMSYSTASHGGIHLDRARQRVVKATFPGFATFAGGPWYEEDQDWCVPVLVFPEHFGVARVLAAGETARNAAKPWGREGRNSQWVAVVARLENGIKTICRAAIAKAELV